VDTAALITITKVGSSNVVTFDPNPIGDDDVRKGTVYQNSENFLFSGFAGLGFNPFSTAGTDFTVNLTLKSTGRRRSRALHLGDDDPGLRWRWLHGLSSEAEPVSASSRLILT
jgi:hypothetical protein